jgi:hypothetical protein
MAQLLRQAIDSGAPPSLARLPMTPEEVAASYDALEAEADQADEADQAGRDEERESGEDIQNDLSLMPGR